MVESVGVVVGVVGAEINVSHNVLFPLPGMPQTSKIQVEKQPTIMSVFYEQIERIRPIACRKRPYSSI